MYMLIAPVCCSQSQSLSCNLCHSISCETTTITSVTMSVTLTSNPLTYASAAVLRDYELTHSGSDGPLETSLNAHPESTSRSNNPVDWPTEHRRIPAYRPVNMELDQSERRVYQNPIERAFITTMFTGVYLQSVSVIRRKRESMTNKSVDCLQTVASDGWKGLECRLQAWWRVVMN